MQAGLFEAPPEMVRDIGDWVVGQAASLELQRAQDSLTRAKQFTENREQEVWQVIETAMADLRANMTPKGTSRTLFNAYKLVASRLKYMIGGFAEARSSDFQKLTPESRDKLYAFLEKFLEQAREELEADKQRTLKNLGEREKELRQIESYANSTWPANAKFVSQKFDVNLTGWKYHPKNMQDLIAKRIEEHTGAIKAQAEKMGRTEDAMFRDILRDIVNGLNFRFRHVWVIFEKDVDTTSGGNWSDALNRLTVKMPHLAGQMPWPKIEKRLRAVVQHELRHFSQSYLKTLLSLADEVGKPSKTIQTPTFSQHDRQRGMDQSEMHALDDIEFYTDLADSIDRLKEYLEENQMSKADRTEVVRKFVGLPTSRYISFYVSVDWFFSALKKKAPGKYRKAVSELIKAVL